MSFFYPPPAVVARSRRARDMNRNSATSSGRRHKESPRPREEKSPPSRSPPVQHSIDTEHADDTPLSETSSPTTATPPMATSESPGATSAIAYQLPAALQQYLDKDGGKGPPLDKKDTTGIESLTQSVPDLKAVPRSLDYARCDDVKSIPSEPADLPQDKTPNPRDHGPTKVKTPTSISSSTSYSGQHDLVQERSYTPPAAPLMAARSYSPPVYMSPIPVRAQPLNQHFMSYQGNAVYSLGPGMPQTAEGYPGSQLHNPHYPDYATNFHHSTSGPMERSHTQDTANSAQRKSHRRSDSYTADGDVVSMMHRIASVLPDFQTLLDRYDDVSNQISGETKQRRPSENRVKEVMKEKDNYISRLQREKEAAHEGFRVERDKLHAELGNARSAQHEMEKSLLARTLSRDNLQDKSNQLQRNHDDMAARSRQIELTLESFRAWTLRDMETKERVLRLDVGSKGMSRNDTQQDHNALVSTNNSIPGQYTDSRTTSPVPLEQRQTPQHENAEALTLARSDADAARLKEMQAQASWKAEIEASQHREAQLRESFQHERSAQSQQWSEERAELKRQWQEHYQIVVEQQAQEKEDFRRILDATQTRYTKRCNDLEADNELLRNQIEQLKAQWAAERSHWTQSTGELKVAAGRVERESRHLRRVLETCEPIVSSYGDVEGTSNRGADTISGYVGHAG